MTQKNSFAATAVRLSSLPDSKGPANLYDWRILRLPTVERINNDNSDDAVAIRRSFSFDPNPTTPEPLYRGELVLLPRDEAKIRLYPPFGFMRALGESRADLFDFSETSLAFANEVEEYSSDEGQELARRKVWGASKQFSSHREAYFCLWSYYVWYDEQIIPYLSLDQLGCIARYRQRMQREFSSFHQAKPLR